MDGKKQTWTWLNAEAWTEVQPCTSMRLPDPLPRPLSPQAAKGEANRILYLPCNTEP